MKLRQLIVGVDLLASVVDGRPEESSNIGASEMNRHVSLIAIDRHQLLFLAVNINSGIVGGVSDLVENSRLKCLIRVVITDLGGEVVAVEGLADMLVGLLAFVQQHLQDRLEDLSQAIFRRLCQLLCIVDVLVDAVDARHAVFTRKR